MAHIPVLLNEALDWLRIRPEGTYVDCTLGGGGYAEAIANRLTTGRLLAIDQDASAIEAARERLASAGDRILYFHAGFSQLADILGQVGASGVDGIVAEIGRASCRERV